MWDGYPSNPADVGKPGGATNPPNYEPAESFLQHAREWMVDTNLPYGWGELNFGRRQNDPTGRGRAAWFGDIYRGTRLDGGITVNQFHYNLADLLAEGGYVEDDAWAALCRESEGCRLAHDAGYEDAAMDNGESYRNGLNDAYADVAGYANGKIQ